MICPTGRRTMICPTYHFSYRAGNHDLSYISFILPGEEPVFVLHIICPAGRGTMICPTGRGTIICPTHHLSYTLVVLHFSCPTAQLSYTSFLLQKEDNIICPTLPLYSSIVLQREREKHHSIALYIICPIIQLHSTSFVL